MPYTYRICDVKLENKNLSHQPVYSMSREKMGLYALYMSTLGNMPDLFAGKPHASQLKDPLLYDVPEEYKQADPQFESSSRKRKNIWAFRMSGAVRRRIRPLTAPALYPMYLPTAAYTTRAGSARRGCTASVRRLRRMKRVLAT